VSDFPEKIGSVDGPETEIIIKRRIRHTEAILRVHQQQQQLLFTIDLMYMIIIIIIINGYL